MTCTARESCVRRSFGKSGELGQRFRGAAETAAVCLLFGVASTGGGLAAENTLASRAKVIDEALSQFAEQHGVRAFESVVSTRAINRARRATRRGGGDRTLPRRTLEEASKQAKARRESLRPLLEQVQLYERAIHALGARALVEPIGEASGDSGPLSQSLQRVAENPEAGPLRSHRFATRLVHGCLLWMDLTYRFVVQDADLALQYPDLFFETEPQWMWAPSFSPGAFSLQVRERDVAAVGSCLARIAALKSEEVAPHPDIWLCAAHQRIVADALDLLDLQAHDRERLVEAIRYGCSNPYSVVYWYCVLSQYEGVERGTAMLARVFRESLRRNVKSVEDLHRSLRVGVFPGGDVAIWTGVPFSRFDRRVLEMADACRADDALAEFRNLTKLVHDRAQERTLVPGATWKPLRETGAEFEGMKSYLDVGRAGCEGYSSFMFVPMWELGYDRAFPVFASRPYTPSGHWVGGIVCRGELWAVDGEATGSEPRPMTACIQTSSLGGNQRFASFRMYAPTLAAWTWYGMWNGAPASGMLKGQTNKLYAEAFGTDVVFERAIAMTEDRVNGFDLTDYADYAVRVWQSKNGTGEYAITLSQDQKRQLSGRLSETARRYFSFLRENGESVYELKSQTRMGKELTKAQVRRKVELRRTTPEFSVERNDAILSVLTPEQKRLFLSRLLNDQIRHLVHKDRATAEDAENRLRQESVDTAQWFLNRDDSPSTNELMLEFLRRTSGLVRRPRDRR